MKKTPDPLHIALALFGAIFALVLLFYRDTKTIVIDERWWDYTVEVGHYETEIRTICQEDSCTTQTSQDWVAQCIQTRQGTELPTAPPELRCQDSYTRNNVVFRLQYHVEDEPKHRWATFPLHLWDALAPGQVVTVKMNALARITEINNG